MKTRIAFLLYFLALWILIDQYVKEGYILDPIDIIVPRLTHEKLYLLFLSLAIALSLRGRK